MFNNLINRQDLFFLLNGLRTGSVWRTLKRLVGGSKSAVETMWEQVEGPPSYFWNVPSVCRRANRFITSDPDLEYPVYVSRTYLSPLQPLHGLSLGCGTGQKELGWTSLCRYARLDGYDISAPRIAYARSQAQATGRSEIHYHAADVYQVDWPDAHYDVVFVDQSLHHFALLEPLLLKIRRALKPTGYLVASEFIGPTRFQWTDRQLEVINGVLTILPPLYRRRWSNGRVKTRVYRPSRLSMMLGDPSEAVESARIVPLLEHHFEIVERKDYGGTIIHPLFNDIAHNFLGDDGQEKDEEACRLLELCFQIEDTLLELGDIQSDFALLVCKPPAL
ncbi:MAG: class I SAM-dependent methyltransferase [Chloroflexi bacterium]|nr:class I SAM-dependent methyltransferase [Chloroflexota bacterium]